jgi:UPF0755 protein
MKRVLLVLFVLAVLAGAAAAWMFFGPATAFSDKKQTLYISSKATTRTAVLDSLRAREIIKNETLFSWLADRMGYWEKIKAGKYDIAKGSSLFEIVRMLRNGTQTPVSLTIKKLRTKEDLAKMLGNKFECDSTEVMNFLNNPDTMRTFGVDTAGTMTLIIPDTYSLYWNTSPKKILKKLSDVAETFWEKKRSQAKTKGFTKEQIVTIASIVEEETNADKEKGNIASVYINRLKKGMPLQADPTIKFALRDFTLRRIYEKHLFVASPYNTYRNKGLPPGPICTPSRKTLEAVLNAPETDYFYFVASPQFDGTHEFSRTYEEHLIKAKAYQQALNERDSLKQQ